jgi:hypothetical protein
MRRRTLYRTGALALFLILAIILSRGALDRDALSPRSPTIPPGTHPPREQAKATALPESVGAPPGSSRTTARRILEKCLHSRLTPKMLQDAAVPHASAYRWLLFADPDFRGLVQELERELGTRFPDAVDGLYGELQSPAYKSVLLLLLGASRARGSVALLKSAAGSEDHRVACAASYALGVVDDDDARRFLMDRYRSVVEHPGDYKPGQLKGVLEAGLAASGEKAIPFLLEQAQIANAALDAQEGAPQAGDRYYVSEDCLANLRIDRLSPELKDLYRTETDPRIRSSLLVGLTRNPSAEMYEFLAKDAEDEPRHRLDILSAVGTVISNEMSGSVPDPLADPLRRIFRHGAREHLEASDLQSWIALGCRLGGAEDLDRLRPLFTMDLGKVYGNQAPEVRETLAYSLGRVKDGGKTLSEFLQALPEAEDRSVLLAAALRHEDSGITLGPQEIRTVLTGLKKQEPNSIEVCRMLWPLARAKVEQGAILETLGEVYSGGTAQIRGTVLDTAGKMGAASVPLLEHVLQTESGQILHTEAARQLVAVASPEVLKGRLAPELSELLVPGKPLGLEAFTERGRRKWAYCELVREYYTRVGVQEDLDTLDSIPDRLSFEASVDPEDAQVYRSYLREQCQQAMDAIRLRASLP